MSEGELFVLCKDDEMIMAGFLRNPEERHKGILDAIEVLYGMVSILDEDEGERGSFAIVHLMPNEDQAAFWNFKGFVKNDEGHHNYTKKPNLLISKME